ncbi:phage tail assembly chaperone [Blastochloris sulfoviridis]
MLRWPPDMVWAATPRELAHAARAFTRDGPRPLDRATLEALMARHPDGRP